MALRGARRGNGKRMKTSHDGDCDIYSMALICTCGFFLQATRDAEHYPDGFTGDELERYEDHLDSIGDLQNRTAKTINTKRDDRADG